MDESENYLFLVICYVKLIEFSYVLDIKNTGAVTSGEFIFPAVNVKYCRITFTVEQYLTARNGPGDLFTDETDVSFIKQLAGPGGLIVIIVNDYADLSVIQSILGLSSQNSGYRDHSLLFLALIGIDDVTYADGINQRENGSHKRKRLLEYELQNN